MLRILLLCEFAWNHPRAGGEENYVYEVFSRIATLGHHVTWICKSVPPSEEATPMRILGIDGPIPWRVAAPMMLERLMAKGPNAFHIAIDCRMRDGGKVLRGASFPSLPLHLKPLNSLALKRLDTYGHGIVTDGLTWNLFRAVHGEVGVFAPYACSPTGAARVGKREHILLIDGRPRLAKSIRTALSRVGITLPLVRWPTIPRGATTGPWGDEIARLQAFSDAAVACIGEGFDTEAALALKSGTPCLMEATSRPRFAIPDGLEMVYRIERLPELAETIKGLLHDEVASQRVRRQLTSHVPATSWDDTTNSVLEYLQRYCGQPPE